MFLIPILFGILPGFAWLIFYLSEDPHPEPKRLIVLTFFTGIAFGFFTVIVEHIFNLGTANLNIEEFSILSLLGLAGIEEIMKFSAAYFSISKTPEISDPIDPMIYMIVAAMGFATLENIGSIINIPSQIPLIPAALQTIALRFIGATLLHSLTSGIVGYYWSYGIAAKKPFMHITAGIIIATIIHATFNYLTLSYSVITYSLIFLIVVGFFVLIDFEKLKTTEEQKIN